MKKPRNPCGFWVFSPDIFFGATCWLRGWDLNHTTSGLWARRATNCSTPRYCFFGWNTVCLAVPANLKSKIGAGNRARTGTWLSSHGILSPGRLPISPLRHTKTFIRTHYIIAHTSCCVKCFASNYQNTFYAAGQRHDRGYESRRDLPCRVELTSARRLRASAESDV